MKLQKIGKYEVLDQIAAGGFGVVYKARDPFIKRTVAIKTCPADNDDLRNRFFREAEIVGNLKHPNITIVHDFGVEGEFAYLVQEYLSGEDLLAKIRDRRAMSVAEKLEILLQVAQGLGHAHSQGVIHRDVKPGNIRVLEDGKVKIMDFGIAKLTTARTQLTQKGMTVGTVGYLSPEQVSDGQVTERTDIFGFGVMAYEFLTYRRPFSGKTLGELIPRIMQDEPQPVSSVVPDASFALDVLIARCLAKRPQDRHASFEEIASEIGNILSDEQLASALPGTFVERTQRFETPPATAPAADAGLANAGRAAAVAPPAVAPLPPPSPVPPAVAAMPALGSADRPTVRMVRPQPAPVAAQLDDHADAPPGFDETRPIRLEDLQAAATGFIPTSPSVPSPDPFVGPAAGLAGGLAGGLAAGPALVAPVPAGPVVAAEAGPESGGAPALLEPDHDLSMSGFVPPPLLPPPMLEDVAPPPSGGVQADWTPAPPLAVQPPVGVATSGGGLGKLLLVLVLAAGFFGLLGLGVWWFFGRERPVAPPAATSPAVVVPQSPMTSTATTTGRLAIVAAPWGTVERIVNAAGEELPGGPFGNTPMSVELAPGTWTVDIAHPDLPAAVQCTAEVPAGGIVECAAVTAAYDVNTYFRESGWWR